MNYFVYTSHHEYKLRLAFAPEKKLPVTYDVKALSEIFTIQLFINPNNIRMTKDSVPAFSIRILNSRAGGKNTLRISCSYGPC